jgi:putative protease
MEILSPAGNLEKIKYAIRYGADAVYAGSQAFSLRAKADNFEYDDLLEAVRFCHEHGKKLFVPLNIYAHNRHIDGIREYIRSLYSAQVDAVIVSDLGVFDLIQDIAPKMPIHISTQANVTSYQSVRSFERLGAKRIILARELTFKEILEIRERCPDIELEIFIHGAMCISYSGRCLLSAYLNNRSANLGECTQPCRWKYSLIEESRPLQSFPIEEDEHGFYFMNSKDLCLWNRLSEIYKAGIDSVKIEGRMKSLYYIAAVTRAYKQSLLAIKNGHKPDAFWHKELDKVSHRIYTEGFFDGFDADDTQNYETSTYVRDWQFVGNVEKYENGFAYIRSYHKISREDEIEIIFPDKKNDIKLTSFELYDDELNEIEFTKPNTVFCIKIANIPDFGIIRVER